MVLEIIDIQKTIDSLDKICEMMKQSQQNDRIEKEIKEMSNNAINEKLKSQK